ncbi:MAG: septum formation initiator family protein [Oscillospiraceae bacterium]|nr:septum formation initiator family protein [Oscillospiraceae bacterium]
MKPKIKRVGTIVKFVLFLFISGLIFNFVSGRAQVASKKHELCKTIEKLSFQEEKNNNLKSILSLAKEKDPDYIEYVARSVLGFSKQNERVFVNVLGCCS